jgi:hypothetical protein
MVAMMRPLEIAWENRGSEAYLCLLLTPWMYFNAQFLMSESTDCGN